MLPMKQLEGLDLAYGATEIKEKTTKHCLDSVSEL
jgi:hypothetical protein